MVLQIALLVITAQASPGIEETPIIPCKADVAKIESIAVLPLVPLVQFDYSDPKKPWLPLAIRMDSVMAMVDVGPRVAAASIQGGFTIKKPESVAAIFAERELDPRDLFVTVSGDPEVMVDRKGSSANLTPSRKVLSESSKIGRFSYLRKEWAQTGEQLRGLATLTPNTVPTYSIERVKAIGAGLGVQAVLVVTVGIDRVKETTVGLMMEKHKSSWMRSTMALIRVEDGEVLWASVILGHSSSRERAVAFATGYRKAEDKLAVDGLAKVFAHVAGILKRTKG